MGSDTVCVPMRLHLGEIKTGGMHDLGAQECEMTARELREERSRVVIGISERKRKDWIDCGEKEAGIALGLILAGPVELNVVVTTRTCHLEHKNRERVSLVRSSA
jgi:hypothetical protein